MAIVYIPVIAQEKYDSLRRLLGDQVPDTFQEWGHMLTKKGADAALGGHVVRNVHLDPDEFARYLHATQAAHNLHNLDVFAAEKDSGKNY